MKSNAKLWGSISVLIGVVIAILAIAHDPLRTWLLLAVFAVWGLWLVLAMLLPSMAAVRRYKARRLHEAQCNQPPVSGMSMENDLETTRILLCHVNHRISAYLKSVYPDATWEWKEKSPEDIILQGGTGRIQLYNVPDYNFADVQLDPKANLHCSLMKIVPLVEAEEAPAQVPPNQEPVDPQVWYEATARGVLENLIADLSSRGHNSLTLKEDGAVCVEEHLDEPCETFSSFPQKVYWPRLVKVLERAGYSADAQGDAIVVSW